jgi:hypothetical protein
VDCTWEGEPASLLRIAPESKLYSTLKNSPHAFCVVFPGQGLAYTPLTTFVKNIATQKGIAGTLFWTGASRQLLSNGSIGNVWVDGRPWDSVEPANPNAVPLDVERCANP